MTPKSPEEIAEELSITLVKLGRIKEDDRLAICSHFTEALTQEREQVEIHATCGMMFREERKKKEEAEDELAGSQAAWNLMESPSKCLQKDYNFAMKKLEKAEARVKELEERLKLDADEALVEENNDMLAKSIGHLKRIKELEAELRCSCGYHNSNEDHPCSSRYVGNQEVDSKDQKIKELEKEVSGHEMIQKAICSAANESDNEWVPKSRIQELEAKVNKLKVDRDLWKRATYKYQQKQSVLAESVAELKTEVEGLKKL